MRSRIGLVALALTSALTLAPTPVDAGPAGPARGTARAGWTAEVRGDPDEGKLIEVEVDTSPRANGWFPGLDDPRVQAYFRSDSMVGDSLFDPRSQAGDQPPSYQPLVRAGIAIEVRGASSAGERREARRWARRMVAERLSSLEACYADARQRTPIDASKISLRVTLADRQRGPIAIADGELGDADGNDCLTGVLAFAKRGAPVFSSTVEVEVPVWFWLQSERM